MPLETRNYPILTSVTGLTLKGGERNDTVQDC